METSKNYSYFSKPVTKIAASLVFVLLIILLLIKWCKGTEHKVTVTDPVKAPVAIAFLDANRMIDTQINNIKVTLVDPGGMVVTSNGLPFNEILVSGGVMSLALKVSAQFSTEQPYRFTIKAEAAGYSSNQMNILVSTEEGQYVPIFMAKLDSPPPGMAGVMGTVPLNAGRIGANGASLTKLATPVSNGVNIDMMRIEIPAGAEPIYCNRSNANSPFPQKLNFRVTYAAPLALEASRTFPGGALVTDAADINDSIIATPGNPMYFGTAGWINLEMDADGDLVSGFTKPVTVTMPLPDTLINPQTGQYYKENDKIDIWSLNSRGAWRQESTATIGKDASKKLFANMTVTHFSPWNLDYKINVCGIPPGPPTHATVTYTNNQTAVLSAYTEILTSGSYMRSKYMTYNSGASLTQDLFNIPDAGNFNLRVYQNGPGTPEVTTSTVFSCTSLNSGSLTIPGGGTTNISIQVEVAGGMGSRLPLCAQTIWYKPCPGVCALPAACPSMNPFHFGGILQQVGANPYSEAVISKPAPGGSTDVNCIRIWQGEEIMGVTRQVAIDIPFDFLNATALSETLISNTVKKIYDYDGMGGIQDAATPPEIYYWRTGVSPNFIYHFFIANGFTVLPGCPTS